MGRWKNRVAVITGASSGIGAAIALDLVKSGVVVVGLARRVERVEELKSKLPENVQSKLHAVKCDVSSDESVTEAFDWIEKNLGAVAILVNNAGTAKMGQITTMDLADMQHVMQVNVFGIIRCTRRAVQSMKKHKTDGHIVNINSVGGHKITSVSGSQPISNVYAPSKFAVTALSEVLAMELNHDEANIKVTSVSPGYTDTEILSESLRKTLKNMIRPEDVADAVHYALGTPPNVQVKELTITH